MNRLGTFCLLTLLISCREYDFELESNPIDSNIIIEAREVLRPNSRILTLFCQTERIYPCMNFPLLTEKHQVENSFKITFTSVDELDMCFTALGPATKLIDLHEVPVGAYEIELINGKHINKGILHVTATAISFQFGSTDGIDFVRTETKRVPEKTYWGTIGYHVPASTSLVDGFIQKFTDVGAVFDKQSPGHYFYYEIDSSGDIIAEVENSGYHFMRKFIFQYDGDESKLKELVQVEGEKQKENLHINLSTYKGESYINWGN